MSLPSPLAQPPGVSKSHPRLTASFFAHFLGFALKTPGVSKSHPPPRLTATFFRTLWSLGQGGTGYLQYMWVAELYPFRVERKHTPPETGSNNPPPPREPGTVLGMQGTRNCSERPSRRFRKFFSRPLLCMKFTVRENFFQKIFQSGAIHAHAGSVGKNLPYSGSGPNWPILGGPGPGPTQLLMSGSVWGVDYTQNTPFSILSSMVKVPSRNSRFRKKIFFWPLLIFFYFPWKFKKFLGNLSKNLQK